MKNIVAIVGLPKSSKIVIDVELLKVITDKTNIPVIASGGVGTLDHLYDGIVKGGASAVLAACLLYTSPSPRDS